MDEPKPSSPPPEDPERAEPSPADPGSPTFSSQPVQDVPEYELDARPPEVEPATVDQPLAAVAAPPPTDALPGDAAPTPLIPLKELEVSPTPTPAPASRVEIVEDLTPPVTPVAAPRQGAFTLWVIVYVAIWTGAMWLTLNHRFDRRMDWNTSYFSITARNLLHDGFVADRGGMYLTAGDFKGQREFYAGHPPLTSWLLTGWMRALGDGDRVIRALPLTFTVLNLLLLYALVRRVFGAPAALAATVICSLLPMTAYYGQIVNMEPFVLTFMLLAALGYLAWARRGSTLGFLMLFVAVVLGCWTDWPMYLFTGFLAVAHFLSRRDAAESRGRPIAASLFLLILPVLMFGVFWVYLKINGADLSWLLERATVRMTATAEGYTQPSRFGGYQKLLGRVTHTGELRDWFISLFTPAALLLAALGALLWPRWSRRLALASGEASRRAAFRILLCLVLTQLLYTLAFPEGAWRHEFWQYYLVVPVAVLAGGLCTWLTVTGGAGRRFVYGLADRAGWAVAALIPIVAAGPFTYRMQILGKQAPNPEWWTEDDYVAQIKARTRPTDVILTDMPQEGRDRQEALGYALPWYTDRNILPHEGTDKDERDTRSLEGIARVCDKYKNNRILYLWRENGPEKLFQEFNRSKRSWQLPAGTVLYVIRDPAAPGEDLIPASGNAKAAAGATTTAPSATRPATAPSTTKTTP
jgi:hypothetical protein